MVYNVYFMENPIYKWMMTGNTTIYRHLWNPPKKKSHLKFPEIALTHHSLTIKITRYHRAGGPVGSGRQRDPRRLVAELCGMSAARISQRHDLLLGQLGQHIPGLEFRRFAHMLPYEKLI